MNNKQFSFSFVDNEQIELEILINDKYGRSQISQYLYLEKEETIILMNHLREAIETWR